MDFQNSERVRARKPHRCTGCGEVIRKGDTYVRTAQGYDGTVHSYRHCMRCNAITLALFAYDLDEVDFYLSESLWLDPPDAVAALAFWLPGEHIDLEEILQAVRDHKTSRELAIRLGSELSDDIV